MAPRGFLENKRRRLCSRRDFSSSYEPITFVAKYGKAMQKTPNLVIVESPAKAKTIEKFLGKGFRVLSSYGHIRDLKKSGLGIDISQQFAPNYIVSKDKLAVVRDLKQAADNAEMVWLASDEDREGEAIAWHLYEVLKRAGKPTKRIVFHEITQQAIDHAIAHPRDIDLNLVDAQQARRVLDRIVGFELSPILWKRIKPALSAGRVQSVAVRLIVDREREIQQFVPSSSYKVVASLCKKTGKDCLQAVAEKTFDTAEEAKDFLSRNSAQEMEVLSLVSKPGKRSPAAPFTTSTLQQEAARKLGYTVGTTMRIAQKLYESGHITYMRTDSVNLSTLALNSAAKAIKERWGESYYQLRKYKTKSKGAQEAHEAIRPTDLSKESISGTPQEQKLYEMILKRTLASQMADVVLEKTTATFKGQTSNDVFVAEGEVIRFEGFLKAYDYASHSDEEEEKNNSHQLPTLSKGEMLNTQELVATEHITRAPARYSEASLVRRLEELGIGRPSTYAPTIQVIQAREYVQKGTSSGSEHKYHDYICNAQHPTPTLKIRTEKIGADKGKLLPTDIGIVVNDFLVENFPKVIDYNFTAQVEGLFDRIAEGKEIWTNTMEHFYTLFHPMVEPALETFDNHARGERNLGIDPATNKAVTVRIGRYGPLVQIGENTPTEKASFASLREGQSIQTITLEEALDLFKLPRTAGQFEGSDVKVASGRFGPYIQHAGKFTSIPKQYDPLSITLDECIALIQAKREEEIKSELKRFSEDPELTIRTGRFGPFLKHGKENYKLTKEQKERAAELTYEECLEIIKNGHPSGTRKGSTGKRTVTKSKK